jgi:hypothetical protein
VHDGWVYGRNRSEPRDYCSQKARDAQGKLYTNAHLQACQPNAEIRKPSAERRLTSEFCKTYPKADVCQP